MGHRAHGHMHDGGVCCQKFWLGEGVMVQSGTVRSVASVVLEVRGVATSKGTELAISTWSRPGKLSVRSVRQLTTC